MKFLVPNYSCLQNPWLGGYRLQIPVLSVLCPQLNLLKPPPNKIPGYATGSQHRVWSVREMPTTVFWSCLFSTKPFHDRWTLWFSSVRLGKSFSNSLPQVDCHNTKLIHVPVGTADINACFQDAGIPGCFAGRQAWKPAKQQRCRNLRFRSCYISNLTVLDE